MAGVSACARQCILAGRPIFALRLATVGDSDFTCKAVSAVEGLLAIHASAGLVLLPRVVLALIQPRLHSRA
jgi:hypothetical protein